MPLEVCRKVMSKLAFADVIYWHFMQFAMLFILFGGIKLYLGIFGWNPRLYQLYYFTMHKTSKVILGNIIVP
jgi:hypothetical protein